MDAFIKIAPYLGQPLILVGFVVFLFFGLAKIFFKPSAIDGNTSAGAAIVTLFMTYGFVLSLAIIILGFGLTYLPHLVSTHV